MLLEVTPASSDTQSCGVHREAEQLRGTSSGAQLLRQLEESCAAAMETRAVGVRECKEEVAQSGQRWRGRLEVCP